MPGHYLRPNLVFPLSPRIQKTHVRHEDAYRITRDSQVLVVQNVICATTGVETSGWGLGELLCHIDPGPRADGERAQRQPIPALCLILPWRKMGWRHGMLSMQMHRMSEKRLG